MNKNEMIINYRPHLAETLKKDLNFMLNYYSKNFPQMY